MEDIIITGYNNYKTGRGTYTNSITSISKNILEIIDERIEPLVNVMMILVIYLQKLWVQVQLCLKFVSTLFSPRQLI